ncbi:type II/IV secretion system protein [Candidatus Uhrbacteria bacterium]|nr:type II/IV secretion system protein [Candidatus Uhrbacteria bacterium]
MPDDTITSAQGFSSAEERLQQKMAHLALKQKAQEAQMLAYSSGLPYISLVGMPIPSNALELISEEDARALGVVCFSSEIEEKRVAVLDPYNEDLKAFFENLQKKTHSTISVYVITKESLDSALKLYAQIPHIKEETSGVEISEKDLELYGDEYADIRTLKERLADKNVTDIITILVAVALATRSSDIHIEAEEKDIKARLRIDGILHDVAELSPDLWKQLISRVKLTAGLKINIIDRPQDGRFTIHFKNDKVEVRVSTLPTGYGESVVMRLLRSTAAGLSFEDLGLSPYANALLKSQVDKPNGMVITTGPTGSGKTTTLYAILNYLNTPEIKIITLEDPIEYKLGGINQSQIDTSKSYTFATGLRSILRQDPDIIMVGEIRDLETADTAINAALTGHLVLSTIHTNSAAGAVPRFLAMGVREFLLAPSLNAIIGQRLVRRLCQSCKKSAVPKRETIDRIRKELFAISPKSGVKVDMEHLIFFEAEGCDTCHGLGYKGRIGIYEIMVMSPDIEQLILAKSSSEYQIQDIAVKNGMVTMIQDGLLRALEGITSVDEVFSVAD